MHESRHRSQGTPLALVTTAPRPRVTEALAKHGLTEYFAAVITGTFPFVLRHFRDLYCR